MIRRYCPTDLETLRQITVICFEHVSIDKNIEDHFGIVGGVDWKTRKALHIDVDAEANPNGIFVAEIEDKVVGYITTRIDTITKIGQIPNLAVLPNFQQKGFGQRLIQVALDYFKAKGMLMAKIETLAQNPVGTTFYPKMGFVEVARQIHYVHPL